MVLHFYLGLSLTEAAQVLGIPPGTAKSRLHRGLLAMRAALDDQRPQPRCDRAGAAGMNDPREVERRIVAWMDATGQARAPRVAVDAAIATTSQRRPRPRWLALMKEPPMYRSNGVAVGSPPIRLGLILALGLALLLGLAGLGRGRRARVRPAGRQRSHRLRLGRRYLGRGARRRRPACARAG